MPIKVTERAAAVLRRALELGRMDPNEVGVRITVAGSHVRTGFAESPEPGDEIVVAGGVRLFVPAELIARGATVDVADEHDTIILR